MMERAQQRSTEMKLPELSVYTHCHTTFPEHFSNNCGKLADLEGIH